MRDERDENEGLPILIFMADGMDAWGKRGGRHIGMR